MGFDIYAEKMTRYYSRNWKTSVQQCGEENGIQVNIVRPAEQRDGTVSVQEILEDVTNWRSQLIEAFAAVRHSEKYGTLIIYDY
ncbi:MAG: hypothetical protein IJY19_05100 [Ruminococcus sp.]|nr:hypothetical protein [Ruminococcus sp.]